MHPDEKQAGGPQILEKNRNIDDSMYLGINKRHHKMILTAL